MIVLGADELISIVARGFVRAGAPEGLARRVAAGLVGSDLAGVDTHGVRMMPRYVSAIQSGELDATAEPTIVLETPATCLVSGLWGFGHVAAGFATEVAVRKALDAGVAMVGLVAAHHIGRLGEYVEMAAQSGVALLMYCGGQGEELPAAAPFGGARPVLHTNPIAFGMPAEAGRAIVLDIATTVMAGAKIDELRTRGERLPPGAIIDRDGRPSTDPNALFEGGAHLPFGGHKGYGLMLEAELLGRIVTGADRYAEPHRGGPHFRHAGTLFIAIRADRFEDRVAVGKRTRELLERIRSTRPAPGFTSVQVPGDIEAARRTARLRDGISLPDELHRELLGLAGLPAAASHEGAQH